MCEFNRWDICAAYNMYAVGYNGDAAANEIGCRLSRLRYRPARSEETLAGLSENAKAIYGSLVRRHNALFVGYERLARRGHAPPWPGTMWIGDPRKWLASTGLLVAVESMVRP